jgi:hypothetical protein
MELPEDFGAADAVRGVRAVAECDRTIEDFSRTERVKLLNRSPSPVVVLFLNDDEKQLIDGTHGAMLPYVCPMRSTVLIFIVLLTACGKLESPTEPGEGSPPDPRATFTRVQNEIFTPSCGLVGCHHPIGQQQGMILTQGNAYAMIVNHPSVEMPSLMRIEPGDPTNSYLYRKITGAGISGDRMPQGGPYLNDAQIALVRDWIRRGAPND